MGRYEDINEISDGRLYTENDMVKADTGSCVGCNGKCCKGMGQSIVLDPFDVYRMCKKLNTTFEQLLEDKLELNFQDGIILPNIKMNEKTNGCSFLDENDRCSVHEARPCVCRLFPLGRAWESDTEFKYILQKGECAKANLTKIKVKKWLDIPDIEKYNDYIVAWHVYTRKIRSAVADISVSATEEAQTQIRTICMYTIKTFFMTPYVSDNVYEEIKQRIDNALIAMGMD